MHGSTGRGWKRSSRYRASPSPNHPRDNDCMDGRGQASDYERLMREGARSAGRSGRWRRASGTTVLAALCAGVLAPVVTVVTGGGEVVVAGVAVVGSVGGNVLASVVQQAVDRLRGR